MRASLFLCILNFLLFYSCQATEIFNQAQKLYQAKEYQKAAELYQTIEPKNGAVWYNLGHCYAQQNDIYTALICWRRAQKTAYGQRYVATQQCIDAAEQKLGLPHSAPFFKQIVSQLKTYTVAIPLLAWQVFFLFLWYLVLYLFLRGKRLKPVVSVLLIVFLGCTSGGLMLHYDNATARIALVNDNEVPLCAGTDKRFSHKMVMTKGQPVVIEQTIDTWHKIVCNDNSGWVCSDKLEEITT